MGIKTTIEIGIFIIIAIIADITLNEDLNTFFKVSGILNSVYSISLLNLFKTLPTGVDSKNLILHLESIKIKVNGKIKI